MGWRKRVYCELPTHSKADGMGFTLPFIKIMELLTLMQSKWLWKSQRAWAEIKIMDKLAQMLIRVSPLVANVLRI